MNSHAIDRYFKTIVFTSFQGSLQSLARIISRSTGVYVNSRDLLEYFLVSSNLYANYTVNICFSNGQANVCIQENAI